MGVSDFEYLEKFDAYLDMYRKSGITESAIKELEAAVGKNCSDDQYNDFLLRILDKISRKIGREEEDENNAGCHELEEEEEEEDTNNVGHHEFEINEADKDPMYEAFVKSLRSHKTAYIAKFEEFGLSFDITYEPHEGLDENIDHGKKSSRPSNESQSTRICMESENLGQRKSSTKSKSEKLSRDECVFDPDYAVFMERSKIVEEQPAYDDELDNMIDDEWAPFVEILDRATFYKKENSAEIATDGLKNRSEFRCQLIGVLRKPYDEKEYEKLFKDIESRPLRTHHKDFRNGRERSLPTDKYGKSYLDCHPDLARKLARLHGDRPKCLNLLRGFFFWLEKSANSESFCPWRDAECRSIIPESGEGGSFC